MNDTVAVRPIVEKLSNLKNSGEFEENADIENLLQKMTALNTVFHGDKLSLSAEGLQHLESISVVPDVMAWKWSKSFN